MDGFAIRCMAILPTRHMTFGAGNEARTRDLDLGKVALYQLSYARFVSLGLRPEHETHSTEFNKSVNQKL